MQTKITQKTAVEIFLGILLFLAVIAVVVAALAGANTPEPDLFEGFVTDGEGTRYYDTGVYRTGWQVIDGAHYYFRLETGYMVTGVLSIRGEKFAFREVGTQIRCFDGFRGKFSSRRNETNLPVIRFVRTTIGIKQHFAPRLGLVKITFINIGAYPHRTRQRDGKYRATFIKHRAGLYRAR